MLLVILDKLLEIQFLSFNPDSILYPVFLRRKKTIFVISFKAFNRFLGGHCSFTCIFIIFLIHTLVKFMHIKFSLITIETKKESNVTETNYSLHLVLLHFDYSKRYISLFIVKTYAFSS